MQLNLLGEVLTNPKKKLLKHSAFHRDTLVAETAAFVRRCGRPRQNWTEQLMRAIRKACHAGDDWEQVVGSTEMWRSVSFRVA